MRPIKYPNLHRVRQHLLVQRLNAHRERAAQRWHDAGNGADHAFVDLLVLRSAEFQLSEGP